MSQRTVMPYSATPPKPARRRSSSGVVRSFQLSTARGGHASRADQIRRQRLDLQAVDADHAEAGVQQVLRQREAGRPEADDQHVLADVRPRDRPVPVQRVPARQQAVDLEAPAHPEHVGQHARLRLRDVDRFLLLEHAPLHAVVADAVTGAGQHRVVDADHRERADRLAVLAQDVHLADLLVQRAAADLHAQRVALHRARTCRACRSSTNPSRARGSRGSSPPRSRPRAATCAGRSARSRRAAAGARAVLR